MKMMQMKKGHFDSKTGGNDLFQKSETESWGLAINEWWPKKNFEELNLCEQFVGHEVKNKTTKKWFFFYENCLLV